jgi:error-prone DNA polymerase
MADRSVLQWDKDDCAAAGLVKFDLLGLGMLSALHGAVDLIARAPRGRDRSGHPPPGGRRLRHVVPGRLRGGVPGREPGPDGHPAPPQAPHASTTWWSRWRSSAPAPSRAARSTPTSVAATARSRSPTCTPARTGLAKTSACRCSRSSSCRWPSTWPGSPRPRPTSSARPWGPSAAGAWSACGAAVRRHGRAGRHRRGGRRDLREAGPSPTTASPRATRCRSPTWSTPRPGSSTTSRRRSAPALLNAQPMGFWSPHTLVRDARRHGVTVRTPDLAVSRRCGRWAPWRSRDRVVSPAWSPVSARPDCRG